MSSCSLLQASNVLCLGENFRYSREIAKQQRGWIAGTWGLGVNGKVFLLENKEIKDTHFFYTKKRMGIRNLLLLLLPRNSLLNSSNEAEALEILCIIQKRYKGLLSITFSGSFVVP